MSKLRHLRAAVPAPTVPSTVASVPGIHRNLVPFAVADLPTVYAVGRVLLGAALFARPRGVLGMALVRVWDLTCEPADSEPLPGAD